MGAHERAGGLRLFEGGRTRRRSVVGTLAAALVLLAGWQTAAAATATITVSPASVPQGGRLTVTGAAFAPSETVKLTLDGIRVGSTTAAADGTITKTVRAPLTASVGPHTLTATGASHSSATAAVTVTPGYRTSVLADAPSVYYRLDDAGASMADGSGNGEAASYSTSGNVTEGVTGALKSDPDAAVTSSGGPNAIGTLASASFLPVGNAARTIEAWYRSTDTQRHAVVGYGNSGQSNAFGMAATPNLLVLDVYLGTMEFTTGKKSLDDGKWHYLVVTWDGTNGAAYADDKALKLQTSNVVKPLHTSSPSTLYVGGWLDVVLNQKLVGSLDEVAIYPAALTAAEVTAHYHAAGY
jgi:hypothetical protein